MLLEIDSNERVEIIDVTDDIATVVSDDLETGVCVIYVPHTTAGVIVNENEPRLVSDIEGLLNRLVPEGKEYKHDKIDNNAAAHLRAILLRESVSVPITDGKLALGTWQSIMFVDCDGPRTRKLRIAVASS